MSIFNKSDSARTRQLKKDLIGSFLSLTLIALLILITSLLTTLWLRNSALQLIETSEPRVALLGTIEIGLRQSVMNLQAGILEKNLQYHLRRNTDWEQTIYPALEALKLLEQNPSKRLNNLSTIEETLKNLQMWQWHIEDIAQTPGNYPSQYIYSNRIENISAQLLASSDALIETENRKFVSGIYSPNISTLAQFKTTFFLLTTHLKLYIQDGKKHHKKDFSIHSQSIKFLQQSLIDKKSGYNPDQKEQLTIINKALSSFNIFAKQAISIRETDRWNIASFWLKSKTLPLQTSVNNKLNALLEEERQRLTNHSKKIKTLDVLFPIIVLLLVSLLLSIAYYLTKKGIAEFVGPVILLENQNKLKTDLSILNQAQLESNNQQDLCNRVIAYMAEQMNALVATLYIKENESLVLAASYALPKSVSEHRLVIKPGEGIVGQVFNNNKSISLSYQNNDYLTIHTSTIDIPAKNILVSPIEFEGQVLAVLELAALQPFSQYQKEFLQLSLEQLGISLNIAHQKETIQTALSQSQALSEELQAQQEELRVANEILEKQSNELEHTNNKLTEKTEHLQSTQAETEEKARQLEESGRYKSEFLANMSHELRTPLNSLLILSKMLADNDQQNLTREQIESASVIHNSGSHLLHLINDILDLSKIEAGHIDIIQETIIIQDLLQSLSTRFKYMAIEKGIELRIENFDNTLSSFVSDGMKVEQILTNLIANAIKFTKQGSVTLQIQITNNPEKTSEEKQFLAFEIVDTGIGIEKHKQDAIFSAFQQENGSTSREFGGTGLGLSISLAYAQMLSGNIQLSSVKGQGSTFTLYLPLLRPDEKINTQKEVAKKTSTIISSPFFNTEKDKLDKKSSPILIVEDDPQFSKILYNEATTLGYQCLVAKNAEIALEILKQHIVSGIILDINLPGIEGREFYKRLINDVETRHIPVHIISALDNLDLELKKGIIGYFTKPVSKQQINQVLDRLSHFSSNAVSKVLLMKCDSSKNAIQAILQDYNIEFTSLNPITKISESIKVNSYDAIILDLNLSKKDTFNWLEDINTENPFSFPPIIIYSEKKLSTEDEIQLQKYSDNFIIKSVRSADRLLDEVCLFLHKVKKIDSPSSINTQAEMHHSELNNKRVLIVDDDMRNTFALSKVLRVKGMEVEMASGGKQALSKLETMGNFDIVLMDIMMPEMDGYQTIQEIRKNDRFSHLPIIAVTAKAMNEDKEKCLQAGANDYLSKPIDLDKLQTAMLLWFNKRS